MQERSTYFLNMVLIVDTMFIFPFSHAFFFLRISHFFVHEPVRIGTKCHLRIFQTKEIVSFPVQYSQFWKIYLKKKTQKKMKKNKKMPTWLAASRLIKGTLN